ncbi:NAD-dependent epimerase/dehydratase family protein [Falsigemmobacter faecalis]|uniref:NAD(P)-dependent oxidoreductase n=1 Tax=Falsigemmobacter faecalis TaxID=2488730 RepID=A0A3P3DH03_9RHOB|nr:NAD(P)-dependent oxidoreductase [Falsigemmobacter faecalis]RRH73557.1 NAD(P)-dependent oxidoreductase [Falsigemmobacter faecalis]
MRVLVTGATGFLGGALIRSLSREGRDVVGTGRSGAALAALEAEGIRTVAADLSDPASLAVLTLAGPFDAVVHTAALSSPFGPLAAFRAANVAGTAQALAVARACAVRRFVQISSPAVAFAARDQINLSETAPLPAPINHYARTKREAEDLVLDTPEVGPIILRPRGIYGAGDTALLPRLLRVAKGRPLPMLRGGEAAIDLTHVDDVVSAIRAALDAPEEAERAVYNISGGEMLSVVEIVEAACERAGFTPRWRPLPWRGAMAVARFVEFAARLRGHEPMITPYSLALFAFRQSLDLSRAREALGWQPQISFEEGLRRTFGPAP